jgi:hypothetical protein
MAASVKIESTKKNTKRNTKNAKSTKAAVATESIPETAAASGVVTMDVASPAETAASPAGGDFVVKSGMLMVVPGESPRRPGEAVKASELTTEEVEKFLARGTIARVE